MFIFKLISIIENVYPCNELQYAGLDITDFSYLSEEKSPLH